ncbi:hypothetical protein CgunFtcFv8_004640 [Champsocephalus gunnari]|uniref:Uncharacterized protein n=1 Tax=Champsocephalus gunnari TaxID=52237 RepID=A0AAN8HYD6_CHAGU|nr:hypothetical protein CgunFtcFv8_004640 [Champsocephalus gunnari]
MALTAVQCRCCCPSRLGRKPPVEHRRRPAGAEESRAEVQKQRQTIALPVQHDELFNSGSSQETKPL